MKKHFKYDDVVAEFNRFVEGHETKKAAAEALEISPQYLQDLLKGTRPITGLVWERLGFSKHEDTFSKAS
jgi:plasmid maintenance system antidote protein VapI